MNSLAMAVMFVWFGQGSTQQFDVERFETLAECEASRNMLIELSKGRWYEEQVPRGVTCREL